MQLKTVLLLASLPALGNFLGGLLAEWIGFSKKALSSSLHFATGILLGIIAAEIVPEAFSKLSAWSMLIFFMLGGLFYVLIGFRIKKQEKKKSSSRMIYLAVIADLVGDGILIGTASTVSLKLGLILALGQVLADIPEGFAVVFNFRAKGVKKIYRFFLSLSFFLPVMVSAVLAFFLLQEQNVFIRTGLLLFIAGVYFLASIEDMLSEAHKSKEDTHISSLFLIGGFSFFLFLSKIMTDSFF